MLIVLFHSALGLRAVERQIAAALHADGHDVLVPDLYDGRAVDALEEGLALMDTVGWDAIRDRARHAVRDLPENTVLAGVSMGAGVVSELWRDRPATPAVVLIHGYAIIPDHVATGGRASLHVAVGDRFAPDDTISQWQSAAAAQGIEAQVHRYVDVGHFFTDPTSVDYDEAAAQTLTQRIRTFLLNAD
jgi:dienelactone hydrolase